MNVMIETNLLIENEYTDQKKKKKIKYCGTTNGTLLVLLRIYNHNIHIIRENNRLN